MWRAALRIRTILHSAGYTVDLTKSSANENVGLLERVREAIDDHATIAVSLHYTGGIPFGEANAHFGVTPQQVGRYRTNVTNGDTIRFTNARVAAESQRDAQIIQ
jgi:N-acetylmuramoyl-L-alanine amidase